MKNKLCWTSVHCKISVGFQYVETSIFTPWIGARRCGLAAGVPIRRALREVMTAGLLLCQPHGGPDAEGAHELLSNTSHASDMPVIE
jgi:hypothetical protein